MHSNGKMVDEVEFCELYLLGRFLSFTFTYQVSIGDEDYENNSSIYHRRDKNDQSLTKEDKNVCLFDLHRTSRCCS